MKIVYCIPSTYNSGGMEKVLSVKTNYLADIKNFDITIITTSQHKYKSFFPFSHKIKFIDLGINYDDITGLSYFNKWKYLRKKKKLHKVLLGKVLNEVKADIVISMFTHETSFLYKINDGSKKILELHFSKKFRQYNDKYNNTSFLKKIISCYLNFRDFQSAKHYDKFIVLTNEDKKEWKNFNNIEVISNPISFDCKEVINNNSNEIIAAGRLCPQKGFDLLIEIWAKIAKDLRDKWHLTIYGSGPDHDKLQDKISEYKLNDCTSIHPAVKDIETVYNNSSIFCFTSRYEGFGLSLLEAMAHGLPCITFNCPCGPSEIIDNNHSGILINSFDTDEFSSKLTKLMSDPELRTRLGHNAYTSTNANYNINNIMSKWLTLFSDITK